MVPTSDLPGNAYPQRIELLGYTAATGQPDPTFGAAGKRTLAEFGNVAGLLAAPDGTLRVVGASTPADSALQTGIVVARVSADGTELGATTVPMTSPDGIALGQPAMLPDGSVLVAGSDPNLFIARFTPAGALDPTFGTGGFVRPSGFTDVQVDDVAVDASGRILVSGAKLGNLGRSVGVPIAPLLVRLSAAAAVDPTFFAGGATSGGGEPELSSVVPTAGGEVLAGAPDGSVTSLSSTGDPVPGFGVGGTSPVADASLADGQNLVLDSSNGALMPLKSFPPSGFDNRMAVERVLLTGSGVVAPRPGTIVQLSRKAGNVSVRVPIETHDQTFGGVIAIPMLPQTTSLGDGSFMTPVTTAVGARSGTAQIGGVGGWARVEHGRFSVRRYRGRTAKLVLSPPPCGTRQTTTFTVHGKFAIVVRGATAFDASANGTLIVTESCRGGARIRVRGGRWFFRH